LNCIDHVEGSHHNQAIHLLTWLPVEQVQPQKRGATSETDKITAENTKANTGVPPKETLAKDKKGVTFAPPPEKHSAPPVAAPAAPNHLALGLAGPAQHPPPASGPTGFGAPPRRNTAPARPSPGGEHPGLSGPPRRPTAPLHPTSSGREHQGLNAPPRRPTNTSGQAAPPGMSAPPRRPTDPSNLPSSLKPKPDPSSSATGIKGAPIRPSTKKP
jgi:hypothetical protein